MKPRKKHSHLSFINLFWKNKSKDEDFIYDLKRNHSLNDLINYDEKFNPKRKVEFESVFAGIIRTKPRELRKPVNKVALAIWPEIENAFIKSKLPEFWICQYMIDIFYDNKDIKYVFSKDTKDYKHSENTQITFFNWMKQVIFSKKDEDVYKQMLLIREYGYFFLNPYEHMPSFKAFNQGKGIQIIPHGAGDTSNKIRMRLLWKKYRGDNWPASESLERGRVCIRHTKTCKEISSFGIFPHESKVNKKFNKFIPKMHSHLPGMNVWRVTNTGFFNINARYNLDMPLIAGRSDSIALLLIPAMVAGKLSAEELRLYNLSVISYMVGNGHHSIHEYKTVWQAFNIPYINGDYASLIPDGLIKKYPELLELQEEFPDVISLKLKSNL